MADRAAQARVVVWFGERSETGRGVARRAVARGMIVDASPTQWWFEVTSVQNLEASQEG